MHFPCRRKAVLRLPSCGTISFSRIQSSRSLRCKAAIAATRSSTRIMRPTPCAGPVVFGLPGFRKRGQLRFFGSGKNDFESDQLMPALSGLAVADAPVAQSQLSTGIRCGTGLDPRCRAESLFPRPQEPVCVDVRRFPTPSVPQILKPLLTCLARRQTCIRCRTWTWKPNERADGC